MIVSIIIPIYNASATLPACLSSLKNQTYRNIEAIFVNDCSTDGSGEILTAFAKQMPEISVKIIRHSKNQGVAAARNTGLDAATGDYVYFLDSDDRLEPDSIERMVLKSESENLDIVGCEWYLSLDKNERKMVQPDFNIPVEALRQMMLGKMRWNLWLFMVKRSLYDDIRFIPGQNMGEDMLVMGKLFLKAKKVGIIHEHLYHYSQPVLSRKFNDSLVAQVSSNVSVLEKTIHDSEYKEKLEPILPQLKLSIKLPLLISSDMSDYTMWSNWWPEANSHVMENPVLPFRTKILQWCASRKLWMAVRLYYVLVNKMFYGILYR